jgi:hypothetical protein
MYEIISFYRRELVQLTWDIGSSRDILKKKDYICWGIHSATKQILASQE